MSDVVASDEILRRIQRALSVARREEQAWKTRSVDLRASDPEGCREAEVRARAYEAVRTVLDEIVTPGAHGPDS
ncbi:hypothetical protein [Streptomyces fructofermentans]|uniref:Uncharacterized protein n=1 Tax=Streptomyces fructofermentans TaxID=152141 RepID=A0A918KAV4_9ACTN|nr:hypothetical protein [Streptomyces fructofermentans]GGX57271.1 hypothetical protein GCM10010515_26050 [Streptomyces fructofermentans]